MIDAKQLKEKTDSALQGASGIAQVAQKLGKSPVKVENIVFANPIIPGVAQENRVVGTVFGLQPAALSKSIEGNQGVYVVSVQDFVNPSQPQNLLSIKQQNMTAIKQRVPGAIYQVLQDNAEIEDNRVRFY